MSTLNLGMIGNCNFNALIDPQGRVVWSCWPHCDGDPIFNALLAGNTPEAGSGFAEVRINDEVRCEQAYLDNTAILITTLTASDGASIRITDFAPRFRDQESIFRPTVLVRHIEPIAGAPRITIRYRPNFDYGASEPRVSRGSNHLRYAGSDMVIRLTTDAPIAYIDNETPFLCNRPLTLVLAEDAGLPESVPRIGRYWFESTVAYWQDWARSLSIPFEWQDEVIRAAITLKLCTFEETGAVIAAATTSVPEAPNSERCWDYRYCWLRDSYFVINTLNRLSTTWTMENYLAFITNIAAASAQDGLSPLYSISLDPDLTEKRIPSLAGYRGYGPVRKGNDAYRQIQHDVYGSVILSLTQTFFDRRLVRRGGIDLFRQLETLGERAAKEFDTPDAGIWELRTWESVHTFSAVMCWAAVDRLCRIADHLGLTEEAAKWGAESARLRETIERRAWNEEVGAFTATFDGDHLDASQLLLHELGFLAADDPRFVSTVDAIGRRLRRGDHLQRYATADDFGLPETAFTICTFWYIEALASIGRAEEARALFERVLSYRNPLGLLSEDIDPVTGELWGNFPQTYSMVGLITCAMRLSKSWEDAY